jgi:hypothetical protein
MASINDHLIFISPKGLIPSHPPSLIFIFTFIPHPPHPSAAAIYASLSSKNSRYASAAVTQKLGCTPYACAAARSSSMRPEMEATLKVEVWSWKERRGGGSGVWGMGTSDRWEGPFLVALGITIEEEVGSKALGVVRDGIDGEVEVEVVAGGGGAGRRVKEYEYDEEGL